MRAPQRRRPRRRSLVIPPSGVNLGDLARRVSYVGSAEHKTYPSFAGQPRPRSDATKCDPSFRDQDQLTRWLREALRAGHVGSPWLGDFPRYVWHRHGNALYEAMLVNQELGEYKGYELAQTEWPAGL